MEQSHEMSDKKKKLLLVINPVAGKAEAKKNLLKILEIFSNAGYLVTVYITGKQGDATSIIQDQGSQYDLIVCSGGDGTISEAVTGIVKADIYVPIGYMPCGSSNDFAGYYGISNDMLTAAKSIAHGQPHPMDVISYDHSHYSVNASDFGIFTWIPYNTSQKQKNILGGLAYVLEGIKDFKKLRSQYVKVTANGTVYEGDILFGVICNATRAVATLARQEKSMQADDGIMEIGLVCKPKSPLELQEIIASIRSGELTHKNIFFFKAKKITLETTEPLEWAMDGEHYISPLTCEIESLRNRITLIC